MTSCYPSKATTVNITRNQMFYKRAINVLYALVSIGILITDTSLIQVKDNSPVPAVQ